MIGGTPDSQREFLDTFSADTSADPSLANDKRKGKGKTPPIANQFALGYTYRDVLDADKEGTWELHSLLVSAMLTLFSCRYSGPRFGLPPVRAVSVIRASPQTTPDPQVRPGNAGCHPDGLVRPMDVGSKAKGMDASATFCACFA
jgi:hypothetical protein